MSAPGTDDEAVAVGLIVAEDGRLLLQQATRHTLSGKGLDVGGLTDIQMSDNHFHLVFPNLFMTIRAGEATVITSAPHPDGDPNRCFWQVQMLQWLPPGEREAKREPLRVITSYAQLLARQFF